MKIIRLQKILPSLLLIAGCIALSGCPHSAEPTTQSQLLRIYYGGSAATGFIEEWEQSEADSHTEQLVTLPAVPVNFKGFVSGTSFSNGMTFFCGGDGAGTSSSDSAIILNAISRTWTALPQMHTSREYHTVTTLANGKIFIAGGFANQSSVPISSTELFDTATRTFMQGPQMSQPRGGHAAVLLKNGKVLLVGGSSTGFTIGGAEIYDPITNTIQNAATMVFPMQLPQAVLLPSGNVFITDGANSQIYNVNANTFQAVKGTFTSEHFQSPAIALTNNKVLISGGKSNRTANAVNGTDIYDPATDQFTAGPKMTASRRSHAAIALPDGRIIVAGGYDDLGIPQSSQEIYDPKTGSFTKITFPMRSPRTGFGGLYLGKMQN